MLGSMIPWFVLIAILMKVMEYFFPYQKIDPSQKNLVSDFLHLGLRVLLMGTKGLFVGYCFTLFLSMGIPDTWLGMAKSWPLWLQIVSCFLICDFVHFLTHWASHVFEPLWKIHAVHHAPTKLYWEATFRIHSLSILLYAFTYAVPIAFFGWSSDIVTIFFISKFMVTIPQHANIGINCGPLNYVIQWWDVHRWHHATDKAAWDKNFSAMFSVWDLIFGTFYLPKDKTPTGFGVANVKNFPQGFRDSQLAPFRYNNFLK